MDVTVHEYLILIEDNFTCISFERYKFSNILLTNNDKLRFDSRQT